MRKRITDRQQAKLLSLIVIAGKDTYRHTKVELNIPAETTLTRLTSHEASRLIDRLIKTTEAGQC